MEFKKVKQTQLDHAGNSGNGIDKDTLGRLTSRPMAVRMAIANGYKLTKKPEFVLANTPVLVTPRMAPSISKRDRDNEDDETEEES